MGTHAVSRVVRRVTLSLGLSWRSLGYRSSPPHPRPHMPARAGARI
jgi:hypothetical protein